MSLAHLKYFRLVALLLPFLVIGGCNRKEAPTATAKAKPVVASPAMAWLVEDFQDFTGRIEAVHRVELRAMVTGYLQKVHFKEGAEVNEGDILFEVDPLVYEAKFDQAEASVLLASVHAKRLKTDRDRAEVLYSKRAISKEDYDKVAGDYQEAVASLRVAEANRKEAAVNLGYTKVRTPISGRTSRTMIDPGNLVKSNETMLTSVMSQDPVYAYFDIDERTLLRLRKLSREGKIQLRDANQIRVKFALSDEEDFNNVGSIDFVDNQLVPTTGTLRLRGVFPNKKNPMPYYALGGSMWGALAFPDSQGALTAASAMYPGRSLNRWALTPGLFVRVRMPIGTPSPGVIVAEQAIGTDQERKFVYVVDKNDKVVKRNVQTGPQIKVTFVRKTEKGPFVETTQKKDGVRTVAYQKIADKDKKSIKLEKNQRVVERKVTFRVVSEAQAASAKLDRTDDMQEKIFVKKYRVIEPAVYEGEGQKKLEGEENQAVKEGEAIVVSGLQRVRAGDEVDATLEEITDRPRP
jgi:RND family efflux transporter MFP subunit